MDWVYVIGPAIGALVGGIYGRMLGGGAFHRMTGSGIGSRVGGNPGWAYTFAIIGGLWGLMLAVNYRRIHRKGDTARGEFLTETKEYNKQFARKKKKKGKTDKESE